MSILLFLWFFSAPTSFIMSDLLHPHNGEHDLVNNGRGRGADADAFTALGQGWRETDARQMAFPKNSGT